MIRWTRQVSSRVFFLPSVVTVILFLFLVWCTVWLHRGREGKRKGREGLLYVHLFTTLCFETCSLVICGTSGCRKYLMMMMMMVICPAECPMSHNNDDASRWYCLVGPSRRHIIDRIPSGGRCPPLTQGVELDVYFWCCCFDCMIYDTRVLVPVCFLCTILYNVRMEISESCSLRGRPRRLSCLYVSRVETLEREASCCCQ